MRKWLKLFNPSFLAATWREFNVERGVKTAFAMYNGGISLDDLFAIHEVNSEVTADYFDRGFFVAISYLKNKEHVESRYPAGVAVTVTYNVNCMAEDPLYWHFTPIKETAL